MKKISTFQYKKKFKHFVPKNKNLLQALIKTIKDNDNWVTWDSRSRPTLSIKYLCHYTFGTFFCLFVCEWVSDCVCMCLYVRVQHMTILCFSLVLYVHDDGMSTQRWKNNHQHKAFFSVFFRGNNLWKILSRTRSFDFR